MHSLLTEPFLGLNSWDFSVHFIHKWVSGRLHNQPLCGWDNIHTSRLSPPAGTCTHMRRAAQVLVRGAATHQTFPLMTLRNLESFLCPNFSVPSSANEHGVPRGRLGNSRDRKGRELPITQFSPLPCFFSCLSLPSGYCTEDWKGDTERRRREVLIIGNTAWESAVI